MPGDLKFSDLVDFLADHDGRKVYVEIGVRDQEARESDTDEFVAMLHGHRLGVIQDATDPDAGGERKAVMVRLHRIDAPQVSPEEEKQEAGTRLFFNPRRITKIQGDPRRVLKVWRDDGVYVSIGGP
jgi:hypothetical protein